MSGVTTPVSARSAAPEAADQEGQAGGPPQTPRGGRRFLLLNAVPSWLVSAIVHFVALLVLALVTIEPQPVTSVLAISAAPAESIEEIEVLQEEKIDLNVDPDVLTTDDSQALQQALEDVAVISDAPEVGVEVEAAPLAVELSDFGEETAPKSDLLASVGAVAGGSGLSGRGDEQRGKMVAAIGGSAASEAAVAAALKWFSEHQNDDGSWNFDHRTGPCRARCGDGGTLADCRTGATAMALLPFLGAGQTHKEGAYKKNVERGLYFLTSQMKVRNQGGLQTGDLAQGRGSMYSHGLSAIALTEAYAMTQDRQLMLPAQLALNHIMYAQDPIGGGWRYAPRQPGDTSVVGWQLMALKSGHMAYLAVEPRTIQGAMRFLDGVQADGGAKYGYTGPGQGIGTTSVGLLCRMYLGWKQDHPALQRGVQFLDRTKPSRVNLYFDYYATQVMRQYCGDPESEQHELWQRWNKEMRDWLVSTQDTKGHQKGSWFIGADNHSEEGGRLYCTSMATMILEVYYRHMPIYGKAAATEEFPL